MKNYMMSNFVDKRCKIMLCDDATRYTTDREMINWKSENIDFNYFSKPKA